MHLLSTRASIALTALTLASVVHAQDANCSVVYNDFSPSATGAFQKCYTDQTYNTELVAQGPTPDLQDLMAKVCAKPACSHSTLVSATSKYLDACSASIDAEAANGNILQIGKNALEIFFAEPIRAIYCTLDPNAPPPAVPVIPPAVSPPAYCLGSAAGSPSGRFATHLAIYLTSGALRASQEPFFIGLDQADTCSPCSQRAINSTVEYLALNRMPKVAPFYTPEFVQYWQKFVPAYNALCKTTLTQTWPEGTLNQTVAGVPTGNPTLPPMSPPTAVLSAPGASTTGLSAGRTPSSGTLASSFTVVPLVVSMGAMVALFL